MAASAEVPGSALYHLTLAPLWREGVEAGSYTTSTLGRSLADEGFIHLSRAHQVRTTLERFFSGERDVVLLTVDAGRLGDAVVDDAVGEEFFPHLYGPLPLDAVVAVQALPPGPDGRPRCPPVLT